MFVNRVLRAECYAHLEGEGVHEPVRVHNCDANVPKFVKLTIQRTPWIHEDFGNAKIPENKSTDNQTNTLCS